MIIFRLKIERRPFRKRVLPFFFLLFATVSLIQIVAYTGFFADERLGKSIVPRNDQLARTGPYIIKIVNQRHQKGVRFSSVLNGVDYFEGWESFNQTVNIAAIADRFKNEPEAYLWIYNENPNRRVWKIEIAGKEVFSYEDALIMYKIETRTVPNFFFGIAIVSILFFFASMVKIDRQSIS